MTRWRLACIALPMILTCATTPEGEAGRRRYRFPNVFRANQTVRVTVTKGGKLELLASVQRSGGDYDVTLFDPLFAAPLLRASSREGAITEELLAPSAKAGWGIQLLALLREVYNETYLSHAEDAWNASSRAASLRIIDIDATGRTCAFPKVIEVKPRAGVVRDVRIQTLQADCEARDTE
jgi:hypothetical protein